MHPELHLKKSNENDSCRGMKINQRISSLIDFHSSSRVAAPFLTPVIQAAISKTWATMLALRSHTSKSSKTPLQVASPLPDYIDIDNILPSTQLGNHLPKQLNTQTYGQRFVSKVSQ